MTPEPTNEELRELLGAYALDALDPDERERVDELLLRDAAARAELHELEHAAAWLGHASLRPPARAWDAIAAEVADDLARPTVVEPAAVPDPTPLATRERARSRPGTRRLVAVAAATAVLVLGAAGAVTLADRSSNPDTVAEQAREAIDDGTGRTVTLGSDDVSWSARVVVVPEGTGYLDDTDMPAPRPGRDMQLWSITPEGPVSAGVIRGEDEWHEFEVADGATAFAVTEEPRGGSPEPTGTPIVSGDLQPA